MSILDYLFAKDYYTSVKPAPLGIGQFCWIVSPHIDPVPRILSVERESPEEHLNVNFLLREANRSTDFQSSERVLPVKYLRLRSNEELLTQRAKRRRGIVLASNQEVDDDLLRLLKQKGKKHLHEPHFFVVPCYSTQEDAAGGTGVPPEMTQRIQCMLYRQYFYCPASLSLHRDLRETIARFDRIQAVAGNSPHAIAGIPASLSEEAFAVFRAMALFCLTGEEEPELASLRKYCREAFEKAQSSSN